MNNPLKYSHYEIVFQEVPNEVTLVFEITGCTHHCDGCHSKFLWDYYGEDLLMNLQSVIDKYSNMITCVCLMGGEQNIEELVSFCYIVHNNNNLKTCIYTGDDNDAFCGKLINKDVYKYFDYYKVGEYRKDLGGLDSINTNQKMYKFDGCNYLYITNVFIKRKNQIENS